MATTAPTTTVSTQPVIVYMDATDYEEGLGTNWNGVTVYPNEKSVVYNSKCVKNCGIVEVKVEFSRSISSGTADYFKELSVSDIESQTPLYWQWQQAILDAWKAHRSLIQDKLKVLDAQIKTKEAEIKAAQ